METLRFVLFLVDIWNTENLALDPRSRLSPLLLKNIYPFRLYGIIPGNVINVFLHHEGLPHLSLQSAPESSDKKVGSVTPAGAKSYVVTYKRASLSHPIRM